MKHDCVFEVCKRLQSLCSQVSHCLTSGRIATIVWKRMSSGYSAQVNQKAGKLALWYLHIGDKTHSHKSKPFRVSMIDRKFKTSLQTLSMPYLNVICLLFYLSSSLLSIRAPQGLSLVVSFLPCAWMCTECCMVLLLQCDFVLESYKRQNCRTANACIGEERPHFLSFPARSLGYCFSPMGKTDQLFWLKVWPKM